MNQNIFLCILNVLLASNFDYLLKINATLFFVQINITLEDVKAAR